MPDKHLTLEDSVDLRMADAWIVAQAAGIELGDEVIRVMRLCFALGYVEAYHDRSGPRNFGLLREHEARIRRRHAS
jgi:hypothetical protein